MPSPQKCVQRDLCVVLSASVAPPLCAGAAVNAAFGSIADSPAELSAGQRHMDSPAEDHRPPEHLASGPFTAHGGSIPASPKLGKGAPIINRHDLSFRRAAPDLPFFAEPDAGDRDGPLPAAMGLLYVQY